jgi:hypothetical protein
LSKRVCYALLVRTQFRLPPPARRFPRLFSFCKLHELQQQRKQIEATRAAQLRKAAAAYVAATKERNAFNLTQNGFEFSISEIEEFLTGPDSSSSQFARVA